jgi:carbonic anhydrase
MKDALGVAAYPACADAVHQQSPIALPAVNMPWAMGGTPLDATTLQWSNMAQTTSVINNGHTWLTAIEATPANSLTYGQETYTLKQFHFHAPSEHTLGGKSFPMEMHFVHQGGMAAFATVVALFVQESPTDNPELAKLWDAFSTCAQTQADPLAVSVDLTALLPKDTSHFEYDGSLTAPPCTRIVHFFVVTSPISASAAQIGAFNKALGTTDRPTQPVIDEMAVLYKL